MDDRGGSFVAVRRISQGLDRSTAHGYHSPSGDIVEFGFRFVVNGVADVVAGSAAWLGKGLSCVCAQRRDSDDRPSFELTTNQETLRALWDASYPGEELHGLVSEQWKDMGWQGKDPSTDFRGGGFISLENLLFFARSYKKSFQDLLRKQEGDRAMWEYPFAVAGVNITFMLTQMLDLEAVTPRTIVGAIFAKLLSENERAFDLLYCITFKVMDQQWLEMRASYMDFNTVMKSTRRQLEKELLLDDITSLEDLPSYSFLQ
ncbi:hypothetical protein C5167_029986 [Papaver somniferum]|nr:hypothetical protein C5167_029986 [Papaver somniferum]